MQSNKYAFLAVMIILPVAAGLWASNATAADDKKKGQIELESWSRGNTPSGGTALKSAPTGQPQGDLPMESFSLNFSKVNSSSKSGQQPPAAQKVKGAVKAGGQNQMQMNDTAGATESNQGFGHWEVSPGRVGVTPATPSAPDAMSQKQKPQRLPAVQKVREAADRAGKQ